MRTISTLLFFIFFTGIIYGQKTMNGFYLQDPLIPMEEIYHGGPPRDGIPSIDNPIFKKADEFAYADKDQRILGVLHNGVAKAYPIRIMDWHEIVNDEFDGEAVVITYCPLCGSGAAFSAEFNGAETEFGVSGLLYNSDVLLYDRRTESLWSQIEMKAVNGPMKGTGLEYISTANTTLGKWLKQHPDSRVLSTQTGHGRDYTRSPYGGYERSHSLYFPVSESDNSRFHPKELVLGVEVNEEHKAYPFSELNKSKKPLTDQVGGQTVIIKYDPTSSSASAQKPSGEEIPSMTLYWFAWYAFHPEGEVFEG